MSKVSKYLNFFTKRPDRKEEAYEDFIDDNDDKRHSINNMENGSSGDDFYDDEAASLLETNEKVDRKCSLSYIYNSFARARNCLFRPFKQLPLRWFNLCYMEILVIIAFLAFNIAYAVLSSSSKTWKELGKGEAKPFGKIIGKLLQIDIALLLLPVSRNSIFIILLGLSFERQIKYHRWLGRFIFLLMTFHMVLFWVEWLNDKNPWHKVQYEVLKTDNIFGELAWASCLVMLLTSFSIIRRWLFEVFYKVHLLLVIPFFVFGILHEKSGRFLAILAVPALLHFFDIAYRLSMMFRHLDYKSVKLTPISDGFTKVTCKFRHFQAGQYAFLYIPSIGPMQLHPFSFSCAPNKQGIATFHVKSSGRWTKRLHKLALKGEKPLISLEGPYGTLSTGPLFNYKTLVFFAGGIGITPIISLVQDLQSWAKYRKFYRVLLVWTFRDIELVNEFSGVLSKLEEESNFEVKLHSTKIVASSLESKRPMISGRPDTNDYIQTSKQLAIDNGSKTMAVISCGPKGLVYDTRKYATANTSWSFTIDFHSETFEL